jgi:hypothetical protein
LKPIRKKTVYDIRIIAVKIAAVTYAVLRSGLTDVFSVELIEGSDIYKFLLLGLLHSSIPLIERDFVNIS